MDDKLAPWAEMIDACEGVVAVIGDQGPDEGGYLYGAADVFDEPGPWGIVLADLARQCAQHFEGDEAVALSVIARAFLAELHQPTDTVTEWKSDG